MTVSVEWFASAEPRLIRREDGGWLAVSPAGSPLRVGVAAWSAEDAKLRFRQELREWKALMERTATEP